MFNIEVMERIKGIQLYSSSDKGFVMTNLMNLTSKGDGCYSRLIDSIKSFHWENAELKNKTEKVCFFFFESESCLGLAISGTREVGIESVEQAQCISKAIRELISREYESFSDDTKKFTDALLQDYKKNGCLYHSGFSTIYYDDGTTKEKEISSENVDFKDLFGELFEDKKIWDSFEINQNETSLSKQKDMQQFNLNALVVDDDGFRGKLSKKKCAEIIKEYTFSEYELESIYKFLPKNIPDNEKNMYASALLSRALQAAYIALLNQKEKVGNNGLDALIQNVKKKVAKPEKTIIIDAVFTKKIKGETYKQVSYWRDGGRYSTIVEKDAVIPEAGKTMSYSELQNLVIPSEKFAKKETYNR